MRRRKKKRRVLGAAGRPRLCVCKSAANLHAQIINDDKGVTLVAASTVQGVIKKKVKNGGNIEAAKVVGEEVAKRAKEKGISKVVFDRGRSLYHGRIKALADSARAAGLQF
jgi:large subunit ribosomal protein L18